MSLIQEYEHWYLVLRPQQITFGSMVVISKSEDTNFGDLSTEAFVELKKVISDIETKLRVFLKFEKINYKMLMMVDPEVHFHVFPRYLKEVNFMGREFMDIYWPGLCDISKPMGFTEEESTELLKQLKEHTD
ncbi:MAG: HIT family protein [Bacteroidetes bacterium]|nr:HIT family protein [Bacteroidota bacterium]MDA1119075.1 HIT family protein [Bacteroidota bacterium]